MPKFGIVQGRLTPSTELQAFPEDWQAEFPAAKEIGLDYIELVAEREFNKLNPIWHGNVVSPIICNDHIINHSLNNGIAVLRTNNLIDQAIMTGTDLIVLPLFEASANTSNDILTDIELYAAQNHIRIALETTENDRPFNLVYDTGNRVVEGINLAREIKELGSRIVHVHIKDKNEKGENCLLGTGLVNFQEVMQAFKDIGYDGTYTFETVRGKDPIRTAKYNLEFIKFFMAEAQ